MITVTTNILITAPTESVFRAVADPHKQAIWDPDSMKDPVALNSKEPCLGACYRCRVPGMGIMHYEFATYQPFSLFVHDSKTSIANGVHEFSFSASDEGTLFSQTMKLRPKGWGYLLYPFMGMLTRRRLQQMNKKLKQYLEQ